MTMQDPPARHGRPEILHESRHFRVETRAYVDPPTGERYRRTFVLLGGTGAVVVLPLLDEDGRRCVVFVRQYRHAVEDFVLELPAGRIDEGEKPVQAGFRELWEETGYRATELEPLVTRALVSPGWTNEVQHYYLATGLRWDPVVEQDKFENVVVELVPLESVPDLIRDGVLVDGKSLAAFGAYLGHAASA